MAKTFDLKKFTLGLTPPHLNRYCNAKNHAFTYAGGEQSLDEAFELFYTGLDRETQQIIDIDFSDVNELTTGIATNLLIEYGAQYSIRMPEDFDRYTQNEKALWFFLKAREIFDRVYQEYEFQDMTGWKYVKSTPKSIEDPQAKADKLGKALSAHLFGLHMYGKICYVRPYIQDQIQHFTAFPEGYTRANMEYDKNQKLNRLFTKPVDRIHFSYEPSTGRIGVKARGKAATIQAYQNLFNNMVLENFDVLADDRIFDLNKLKDPNFSFDAPSQYRLKYVKVKTLMIKAIDKKWRFTIDVYDESKTGVSEIHEVLRARNLHLDEYLIQQAIIKIQFEKTGIYRSRDSVTFRLNWPNAHNLSNKKRDMNVKELLKIWNLDIER